MNYPKISIVTPSYNQAQYLEATIKSILGQGYPNLEYIIIDGGSTDASVDIIKKYESQITYWVSEPDGGMYAAIQKGLEKCTGTIMAWLNSDDVFIDGGLFSMAEIFTNNPDIEWCSGAPTYIDEAGKMIGANALKRWSRYTFLTGDYKYIHQSSTFWRNTLWQKAGSTLDVNSQLAGDFELWLRFFRYAKCYVTPALVSSHRSRSKEQKSVEGLVAYTEEVLNLIASEPLDAQTKKTLNKMIFWKKVYALMPFKRLKNYIFSLYQYPPILFYDVVNQQFIKEY